MFDYKKYRFQALLIYSVPISLCPLLLKKSKPSNSHKKFLTAGIWPLIFSLFIKCNWTDSKILMLLKYLRKLANCEVQSDIFVFFISRTAKNLPMRKKTKRMRPSFSSAKALHTIVPRYPWACFRKQCLSNCKTWGWL